MPRRVQLSAILAALVLVTAGCVATNDAGGKGRFAGETVEVAAIWTGTEQASFRAVLDAFEEDTGATVRYTSGGDDLPTLLNSRLAGGSPPDVALLGQPGVVAQYARRGVLAELTGEAAEAVRAHYSPFWVELGSVEDALYGVHYKVAHKSLIWYRVEAFDEAGVSPPQTWPELLDATRTLADAGVGTMSVPGADGWVLTDWFENAYLRVAGAERYDQLAQREIPWTDPSVVATLELLQEYWTLDRAVQGDPLQLKFDQAVADVFGPVPKSAMLFQADFVAAEIQRLGTVAVGDQARFFPWPSIDGSPSSVVVASDQAVAFTDRPAAMALLAFLASPAAAEIAAGYGGFLSANQHLDLAAYPEPETRELAESLHTAEVVRFDLSDLAPQTFGGGTSASMWRLLQEFLADPADPARLAQRLEAAAERDFGTRP
ncbi:carbohydrate ABC transporter substrate-binding protein [Natronosporangium hydrolyticum]|uniref:Carbohydrate ABC transporter substrate-binding protein n=1 Tax=Natronosporangium hydrolyticum TaxID=2811111 RepID=A0A895YIW8_9ACTN|nr:ABC transporter substrate-binding protein [Natronosporangium hydrolyticum]QSB13718.1 carbohydrate ABC transporter substrate-binding protein [Natronosporangium hydrolyticum]